MKLNITNSQLISKIIFIIISILSFACVPDLTNKTTPREKISLNQGWKFYKYTSANLADSLIYDVRPEVTEHNDSKDADTKPTEALDTKTQQKVLKPWILPTSNNFIKNPEQQHQRPEGNPGENFLLVKSEFNDSSWDIIDLPHDWAINEPFYKGDNPEVGGGMGRLPSHGVAWYRKKLNISESDKDKSIFLDIDGAMSYAMVWLNGKLVGGWPYGYNSWRLNLTPYIIPGGTNQLAIRVDNPNYSARWYPGGGIYRNVWLTKTNPVHIGHWGTFVKSRDVSEKSATVDFEIHLDNDSETNTQVEIITHIYELDEEGNQTENCVAETESLSVTVTPGKNEATTSSVTLNTPKLWGPPPTQNPNLYIAITSVLEGGEIIDKYETRFGIRSLEFNPDKGILVNGEPIKIKGVNQHHDLGALGAAFNTRAAERQLEILRNMGCNAIRMAHNPPAPELLELTDKMGFLVMDEIFDSWERKKTPHDFHLLFPDWHEADTRALIRRDRNCPSIIIWSFGNEVGEQYTAEEGASIGLRLHDIVKEEDPTRPTITAMNFAKSFMELPKVPGIIGLNYQGEGIRQDPIFEGTVRIQTPPSYNAFHSAFPDKVIMSTETASSLSTRGTYLFPVSEKVSAPVREGKGGDAKNGYVSAYELYAVDFGSTADKVFASIDKHPFVAGEFVWTGWDYIGEPTPYYSSRSSYSGIIDLAGFPKDRYYLYQSHWRPDLPMAHILPHWNWPDRIGKITPVHVFTSGDEAELFLNGKSLGRKKKGENEYRLRWDDVKYEPGELKVIAYKDGKIWHENSAKTTGRPAAISATADRSMIKADGCDLSFITVRIVDEEGLTVPDAMNKITFSIDGPGKIVATDNGNPTDMLSFSSHERNAFNGLALVIVKSIPGESGTVTVYVNSEDLDGVEVMIESR